MTAPNYTGYEPEVYPLLEELEAGTGRYDFYPEEEGSSGWALYAEQQGLAVYEKRPEPDGYFALRMTQHGRLTLVMWRRSQGQTPQKDEPPVVEWLGGGRLRIGTEDFVLTPPRAASLEALVRLGSADEPQLRARSKVDKPGRHLKALLAKHPILNRFIRLAVKKGEKHVDFSQPQASRYMQYARLFATNTPTTAEANEKLWRLANGKTGDDVSSQVQVAQPSGLRPALGGNDPPPAPETPSPPPCAVVDIPLKLTLSADGAGQFRGWVDALKPVLGVASREAVVFEAVKHLHKEKVHG